ETFRRCFGMFKQSAWVQIGYFGLLPGLTPDLPNVLAELRKAAPSTKIELDKDGCHIDDGKQSVTIPAYKIDVVDTTGAGDVWFGSLLTALIKKMSLEQAGKFANRAAADCCSALGTSAGV